MSYCSQEAKELAARFAAAKVRVSAIYERKERISKALEEARSDAASIENSLRNEVGNLTTQYLVGTHVVSITRGSGGAPSIELLMPLSVNPITLSPLDVELPETDNDLPQRAIKLVASAK